MIFSIHEAIIQTNILCKMDKLVTKPPPTPEFLQISFPADRVVLITMNRPEKLNAITAQAAAEMSVIWPWFDAEPSLSVAIFTGAGNRAFCAGADLNAWADRQAGKAPELPIPNKEESRTTVLSRRFGKKPVIAAVNGLAHGGGCEMVINCDLVVASRTADFCLPEVKRGVAPIGGCMPRLIRTVGLQRAMEAVLTGRRIPAEEALSWGFVNKIVEQDQVVPEALKMATLIASHSPDAIICARAGVRQAWVQADVEDAVQTTLETQFAQLQKSENMLEGLRAFGERRAPRWKPSNL